MNNGRKMTLFLDRNMTLGDLQRSLEIAREAFRTPDVVIHNIESETDGVNVEYTVSHPATPSSTPAPTSPRSRLGQ